MKNQAETSEGVTRRDVVGGGIGMAALGAVGSFGAVSALTGCGGDDPPLPVAVFPQPPELVSAGGTLTYPLDIRYATHAVGTPANGVVSFRSRTYNGALVGTTLRIRAGDQLKIAASNRLPPNVGPMPPDPNTPHHFNSTNIHTHGFHVSPGEDDVFIEIHPGQDYTYTYHLPTDHPAGTMWYHPHKHGATAMHLFSGMTGVIIIEGTAANGDLNSVPEIAAANDLVFNINELNLGGLSQPTPQDPYQVPDYDVVSPFQGADSILVVNGIFRPTLKVVPGQVVRLRLLNSSARNMVDVSVQGHDLHLCALDGITIPTMRTAGHVTLATANRADVLLKTPSPGLYKIYGYIVPQNRAPTPVTDADIVAFVEVAGDAFDMPLPAGPLPAPTSLVMPAVTESRELFYEVNPAVAIDMPGPIIGGQVAPNFTLGPAPGQGRRFDPNRIDQNISLGSVIEWTLMNTTAQSAFGPRHPHHIHIHPFQVIATSDGQLNGLPLVPGTWVDTVALPAGTPANPGTVTVRQYYPDNPGFYVIHCHILVHEDIGMMQIVHLA